MDSTRGGNDETMFLPGMQPRSNGTPSPAHTKQQEEGIPGLSADANVPLSGERSHVPPADPRPVLVETPEPYVEPRWARRLKLVVFVILCLELGILLIYLPWSGFWTHNSLLDSRPMLHAIFMNGFFRGAMSGLGFVNIWMGIWEAVTYREKLK